MAMKGQMFIVGALFLALALLGIYGYLNYPRVDIGFTYTNCQLVPDAYLNSNTSLMSSNTILFARNGPVLDVWQSYGHPVRAQINHTWFSLGSKTSVPIGNGAFAVYFNGHEFQFGQHDFVHYICSEKHFYMAQN